MERDTRQAKLILLTCGNGKVPNIAQKKSHHQVESKERRDHGNSSPHFGALEASLEMTSVHVWAPFLERQLWPSRKSLIFQILAHDSFTRPPIHCDSALTFLSLSSSIFLSISNSFVREGHARAADILPSCLLSACAGRLSDHPPWRHQRPTSTSMLKPSPVSAGKF